VAAAEAATVSDVKHGSAFLISVGVRDEAP